MLTKPMRPGPHLEPGTTVFCRGCGRQINVDSLRFNDKFRCRQCGRIMRVTRKLLSFRYTLKVKQRQQAGVRLGATFVFFMCLLAVSPMAGNAGEVLLRLDSLLLLGKASILSALIINIICYGTGIIVGFTLGWLMIYIRRHTQDLGLLGAVMTVFGGLGRVVFYLLGQQVGYQFTQGLPYGLVIWGLLSTAGSLFRNRLFLEL